MHIVIIPAWYQASEEGHVGIFVRDIAENYALAGHQVSVFSFHIDKDNTEKTIKTDCKGFVEYYHYVNKRRQIRKKAFLYFEQYVLLNGQPDIINTHGLSALGWVKKIKTKFKIPIVHTEHLSSIMNNRLTLKLRLQTYFYYRRADHIIAVSRLLAANISKLTNTPVTFISGMVHQDFFKPVLNDAIKQRVSMVCVSDLDQRKGHILLLEALNILKNREMEFKLHLIGDGPEEETLKSYIEEHSLGEEVIFYGRMKREEVIGVLENCELYVSASRLESFGSHIAEGLAMGLYVVTTDCKSPEFYINDENGVIVHEFDAIILADAIELAILEHEVYSKNIIRTSIEEIASPKVVIPQIEDIFDLYSA